MAKRRGNQDGTFYQRSNGTWCGQIMINNKRYTVYAKGIQECRRKLRDKINTLEEFQSSSILFSKYANHVIQDQLSKQIIKASTANVKKSVVRRFVEAVGDKPLNDINKDTINTFTAHLISKGCTRNTINTCVGGILSIINVAYQNELIQFPIHTSLINKGPQQRRPRELPDINDVKEIIETYTDKRRLFLYILLYTGLRGNEAIVLNWEDVDFNSYKIYVNRGYAKVDGDYIVSAPKSNRVGEFVQFSQSLYDIFQQYQPSTGCIFPYTTTRYTLDNIRQSFKNKLAKYGYKGGLHMLRHLHASILLNNNIDLKTIQSQLRHQNIDTTNKYLHELKNDIRESIKRLRF